MPAVQAAAVAAGGFVAGAAVVGLVQRRRRRSSAPRQGRIAARSGAPRRAGAQRGNGTAADSCRSSAVARCSSTCTCSAARGDRCRRRLSAAGRAARQVDAGRAVSAAAPRRHGRSAAPARRRARAAAARRRSAGRRARRAAGPRRGRARRARGHREPPPRYGIERMRFALGVDEDLVPFRARFARDPLIGRSLRRRPWLRAATPAGAVRGARVGDLRAADRVRAGGRDRAAHRRCAGTPLAATGTARRPPARPAARRACWPARRRRCCESFDLAASRARWRCVRVGARGCARAHRSARRRARARLAQAARDPGNRLVDGRDARPARSGPPRPGAGR